MARQHRRARRHPDEEEELAAVVFAHYTHQFLQQERFLGGKWGTRGPYMTHRRSEDFFDCILYHFSDRQARSWLRMSREAFWTVHDLLEDDPIFHTGTATHPQRPVRYQLATFLCRAGAETSIKVASVMSIAEGTVYLYTERVCKALRNIRSDFLAWPGPLRREYISAEFEKGGFPGCLGSGDGSLIRLRDKPIVNGFSYWCRKKFYSVRCFFMFITEIDHRGIFTSYDFGWPGSVQDSRVFRNSDLWINRERYFRTHEYILVDKGALSFIRL
ncbi:hypothetical protein K435DRAFT_903694 [Dendrothele bispora CBS 962.96]|uniref:DDE Tnp4 domain-containing protein n=1 Tax=Dendrothele bispora (strain CBS 962.96) TaxID=1314807 RepID=A0A4V4HF36_DENBC|nr:hypothetical protein K435DRAFT_903694 [Dendrothele bispora CBS 962.96]